MTGVDLGAALGPALGGRPAFEVVAITGTGPVLASLYDGDTLSDAVTWGSYSSTGGGVNVDALSS